MLFCFTRWSSALVQSLCLQYQTICLLSSPCISATLMKNWLRSSSTRLRPLAMNSSKRSVNRAMRSRRSSKPKLMVGRESAIEGASTDESGGRMALAESEGSNKVAIVSNLEASCGTRYSASSNEKNAGRLELSIIYITR